MDFIGGSLSSWYLATRDLLCAGASAGAAESFTGSGLIGLLRMQQFLASQSGSHHDPLRIVEKHGLAPRRRVQSHPAQIIVGLEYVLTVPVLVLITDT